MNRYYNFFQENKREIIRSAIISLVITIAFSLWYFITGKSFEWHPITPISQPDLLSREVLSYIAFATIGAFLYYVVRLWQILKFICKDILNSWPLYNLVKKIVWIILLVFTQFYLVPTAVNWSNHIISFFYNIWFLILYVYPIVGILILSFFIVILFLKRSQVIAIFDNKMKQS